jgi:hypothetical protein
MKKTISGKQHICAILLFNSLSSKQTEIRVLFPTWSLPWGRFFHQSHPGAVGASDILPVARRCRQHCCCCITVDEEHDHLGASTVGPYGKNKRPIYYSCLT